MVTTMNPDISAHALIECVHRYYPAGLSSEDPRYESSAEIQHLRRHLLSAEPRAPAWRTFVRQVEEAFPGCNVSYSNTPSLYDSSYHCDVTLPAQEPYLDRTHEESVFCRLSVLAPVYALCARHWKDDRTERESWTRYPPLPPEFQAHEAKLAALVEATFGFARLSNEVLFTPVPDLRPPSGRFKHRAPWLAELLF